MQQCEATTLPSSRLGRHRCLQIHGVKKSGRRQLCLLHRKMRGLQIPPIIF